MPRERASALESKTIAQRVVVRRIHTRAGAYNREWMCACRRANARDCIFGELCFVRRCVQKKKKINTQRSSSDSSRVSRVRKMLIYRCWWGMSVYVVYELRCLQSIDAHVCI